MAARTYRMDRRTESVAETRQRIIDATVRLHGEKGVLATSMLDIAAGADVSLGTVHRHFPSLEALVPACGGRIDELTRPPGPEIFDGAATLEDRLEILVREMFSYYSRAGRWIEAALQDERRVPALAQSIREGNAGHEQMVSEALSPAKQSKTFARTVAAFTHYHAWQALEVAGVSVDERVALVTDILTRQSKEVTRD